MTHSLVAGSMAMIVIGWVPVAFAATPDFGTDVRPLLSDHCFACHGPDEADRYADLRLDTADGVASVVEPGDADVSELMLRLESDDPEQQMPPPDFHKPLSPEQKSVLKQWINGGAEFEEHWAFLPPTVDDDLTAAYVDQLIDKKIESAGLAANGDADRRSLLRRVCLDITGLPPDRDRIDAFLSDDSPNAYEKLVDELLQSPSYGEHMGRYWLDLVRYGDTHGLHVDNYREMWRYRDWVIDAFNRNLPMDQFIKQQLAGDLLPDATQDQLIASGFNRLNVTTNEGGSIYQEVFSRNVIDRTDAFGTVFMGLTTQCAVCHDHKFDPITQRDYYSLFAFFNSLDGRAMDDDIKNTPPFIRLPNENQRGQLNRFANTLRDVRRRMQGPIASVDAGQALWQQALLTDSSGDQDRGADDGRIRIGKTYTVGPFDVPSASGAYGRKFGTANDFDAAKDIRRGTKVYPWKRNDDLVQVETNTMPTIENEPSVFIVHQELYSSREQTAQLLIGADDGLAVYLNGKQVLLSKGIRNHTPLGNQVTLRLAEGWNSLYFKLINHDSDSHLTYAFRSPSMEVPESILDMVSCNRPTKHQRDLIRRYYREVWCEHPDWRRLKAQEKQAVLARDELESTLPTTLVWRELDQPRQAYVLVRGQYDQPGERVARDTPSFLPPMESGRPRDRLGLANWLTSADHPLTSRVAVNRFWQQIFGTGLVKTSEDFGGQGDPPSHPELLDALAVDFREHGWDVKRLIKSLVMTKAYRRDQHVTEQMQLVDPANRLLARGARYRLDAEVLRDQALAVSGLLVNRVGGPSVKPPQPGGIWLAVAQTGSNTSAFVADEGESVYRRSVYTFWKRTSAPPQLSTFDAPSRESCTARRERTNTPLQALLLMNEKQILQASKHLAKRTLNESSANSVQDRIGWMFETVTARRPTGIEIDSLFALLEDLQSHYATETSAAIDLAGDNGVTLAPWMILASTMLNLDEVIAK
tara:strand:+ start:558185 stop:561127 length:2943 start_codon:yes stop_codon:yes gene_type:complete